MGDWESPYGLIHTGPDCLLDEIMEALEPREVGQIMGIPMKVCNWMPPNVIALVDRFGGIELIGLGGEK